MKQMTTKLLFFVVAMMITIGAVAQVRIGGQNDPTPGSVLDLDAGGEAGYYVGGIKLPNVSLSDTLVIPAIFTDKATLTPASLSGMIVYNTNVVVSQKLFPGVYVWTGSKWISAGNGGNLGANNDWSLRGNAGTLANPKDGSSSNFIGTTDNQDLAFRINNREKMRLSTDGNLGIGTAANVSAILDVSTSTNKAIALPNVLLLSKTDRVTVPNPTPGMIVYNTADTVKYLNIWDGTKWTQPVLNQNGVVAPRLVGVAKVGTSETNSALIRVYFDAVLFDPESRFRRGSGNGTEYVIKKTGLHQLFVNLTCQNVNTGGWYLRILKNGSPIAAMDATNTTGSGASAVVFAIDTFNAGDIIAVDRGGASSGWVSNLTKITVFRFE